MRKKASLPRMRSLKPLMLLAKEFLMRKPLMMLAKMFLMMLDKKFPRNRIASLPRMRSQNLM